MRNKLLNHKTVVRAGFILFQIVAIAIVCATHDIITIELSWPKEYTKEYLHWWFNEYKTPDGWHKAFDLFITVSSILMAAALGVIAECAHRSGNLSAKQMLLCFALSGAAYVLTHCALCVLFEHYYRYWNLLLPEVLSITTLALSETIGRNIRKAERVSHRN